MEFQIRQASGQAVAPESESDEELKLLALNGLMQSDPDRALPLIENLLKSTQSPKLKKNAVYVLAQSNSARARTQLEQIARGGNSPPDGRKVKGTIHWVSAEHAIDAEVRLYDHLFAKPNADDVPEEVAAMMLAALDRDDDG